MVFDASTLVVADAHSHLSWNEVIGLLGGTFDANTRVLTVSRTEPCRSLSTEVQCEMDPGE